MDRDVSPVFDTFDIDLVFKVMKNTLFSTWQQLSYKADVWNFF